MLHRPVLLGEVLELLLTNRDGVYVDGTFGRGGHGRALLNQLGAAASLLGFDKDPDAISAGHALAAEDKRFQIFHDSFANMAACLAGVGVHGGVSGVLLDLGVSSPQLDTPERGFSFMSDGPLDMRMNTSSGQSAAEWLEHASEHEMERVIRDYGEERFAGRISRAIAQERQKKRIDSTLHLARLIESAVPVREKHKHPATRTFQAVRMHVNQELQDVERGLDAAISLLSPGGRCAVISFHSLEDRLVKQFFEKKVKGEQLPRDLPVRNGARGVELRHVAKKVRAGEAELAENIRARSATLRVVEKL